MAKKILNFYHRGDHYKVNEAGEINANGISYHSKSWIFLGGCSHHWHRRITVTTADAFKNPELLNGCLGFDKDSGTVRQWGGSYCGKLPRINGAHITNE